MTATERPLNVFVIAGEPSGDHLGGALMAALKAQTDGRVVFTGVGGETMQAEGLEPLFPFSDITVMGVDAIIRRLPQLLARIDQTASAVVTSRPDVLVIIDAPDFTHRVARRVRRRDPSIPIVDYVSPTVWVWRSGRARAMAAYVDRLMAVLPFEPGVHAELGGPTTTYVGHPVLETLLPQLPETGQGPDGSGPPVLLILPGSRGSEVRALLATFGETVARIAERVGEIRPVLPAVSHLADRIEAEVADWPIKPEVVRGREAKLKAFAEARAALAASGTVTLELAVAGVPMAVAYKLDGISRFLRTVNRIVPFVNYTTMVLPNIILDYGSGGVPASKAGAEGRTQDAFRHAIPDFLEEDVTPDKLADAVAPLLADTDERRRQLAAFERLHDLMRLNDGALPSEAAARTVLGVARTGRPALSAS
ncbi:lipid-A-disaccharide synthase [Amorphus orientalis]|uniref:Lipid-A-disaccharide synthase n=1 Tax=Amorphus orientalis TaxID=649198 RepID=A0AAE4AT04_9HYPH|nr:lipid-A-disaccharide synthase [Amorphus orientalis]MDQ0315555.1 lipid-A-disaccharide synthase [Amorphus orientalis]